MNRRLRYYLIANIAVWLVIIAPAVVLLYWWTSFALPKPLIISVLLCPVVSAWVYISFQSSNLLLKWPVTQLIGANTILISVLACSAPLLFLWDMKTVAAVATVIWVILVFYASYKARVIKDTELILPTNKLTKSCRILHLSDIHAGSRNIQFLKKIVRQANNHNPDLIVITGDLVDSSAVDQDYLQPLQNFNCPAFLSLGNHEMYVNLEQAIRAIDANNISTLRNDATNKGSIQIIGIDDSEDNDQVANQLQQLSIQPDQFKVLMYHRPVGFEAAANAGIDLMLSGHTHAGQIWPFGMLVKRRFPRMSGSYQLGDSTLNVSMGTGTWGPTMRLGTHCEMTLIHLQPA